MIEVCLYILVEFLQSRLCSGSIQGESGALEHLSRSMHFVLKKQSFSSSNEEVIAQVKRLLDVGKSHLVTFRVFITPDEDLGRVVVGVDVLGT